VLHRVLHCLDADEVHRALDVDGVARYAGGADVHRHRGRPRHGAQRRLQPVVPEYRRVDTLCDRAELLQGTLGLDRQVANRLGGGRIVVELFADQREPDAQGD